MPPIDLDRIEIRRLSYDDDFSGFHCDDEDDLGCDDFIHNENEAKQYQREKHGTTHIFSYEDDMIDYVTLAMSSISAERLGKDAKKPISLSFYPCLLVGRLAVANGWRRLGIGTYMADWSTGKALNLSEEIGCRYVIVETNESKLNFYTQCDFSKGATLKDDRHIWMYKKKY